MELESNIMVVLTMVAMVDNEYVLGVMGYSSDIHSTFKIDPMLKQQLL